MYTYQAVRVRQTPTSPAILLFAAPAHEIDSWAGIPQRRRVGSAENGVVESVGFQREDKPARINEIARFMSHASNVIQNPLLAAVQMSAELSVTEVDDGHVKVVITPRDLENLTVAALLK